MAITDKIIEWLQSFTPIISVLIVVVAIVLWKLINRVFVARTNDMNNSQKTVISVMRSIVKYVLAAVTVLVVLQINNVKVGSVLAGLGIVGIIVGLALQDVIKDLFMGIHILSDSFFAVGDVVRFDGMEGVIRNFTLRTTKIEDIATHDIYNVCNRHIEKICVLSRQTDIEIPLAYSEDPNRVRKVLNSIAARVRSLDGIDDCIFRGTNSFNPSSISYRISFWCDPVFRIEKRRAVLATVQDVLKEEEIQIPFEQLDIHVKQ